MAEKPIDIVGRDGGCYVPDYPLDPLPVTFHENLQEHDDESKDGDNSQATEAAPVLRFDEKNREHQGAGSQKDENRDRVIDQPVRHGSTRKVKRLRQCSAAVAAAATICAI